MGLFIKPTTPEDLDFIIKAERDPESQPYIGQWDYSQHLDSLQNQDIGHFVVQHTNENRTVGYIILAGLSSENDCIEFRRLVVTEKGMGYGKQVLRLVKSYAFDDRKAHRLWLDVRDYNKRARYIYEAEGFKVEGIMRECVKVGDRFDTLVLMSILKSEYHAG